MGHLRDTAKEKNSKNRNNQEQRPINNLMILWFCFIYNYSELFKLQDS